MTRHSIYVKKENVELTFLTWKSNVAKPNKQNIRPR